MKIKLSKEQKAKLLSSVATGVLDTSEFPEWYEAFTGLKPMPIGMAKKIAAALELEGLTDEELESRIDDLSEKLGWKVIKPAQDGK
ncbi:hypothetical protein M2480_002048 [Parabacteroides sp. PFB2-12]|uniref:hypothetical protein n=1 Tax=unclassified Parabacteroides TaxID=2649774 RepID=UPI00247357D1|nr:MULTISPECIES: hypothetical protein [unclassified Parabacteroides]MDH6342926.1 hypothetical protein [Parabacteroides sp. PM6-13]MDH6391059.1 hypothetical protein [Parabacteroides sp. PFB2-12]